MGLAYSRLSIFFLSSLFGYVKGVQLLHLDFSAERRFPTALDCPRWYVS